MTGLPADELARLEELDREGRELLAQGKFAAAAAVFEALCRASPEAVPPRNNLATAYYWDGQWEKALAALAPNLAFDGPPNPYGHGLAARILAQCGRHDEGRAHLRQAVRDFEAGLAAAGRGGPGARAWKEYTLTILQAAAALGDHRQLYELYRGWEQWHVAWECHYLGGVAAFNLGRYDRAVRCWRQVGREIPLLSAVARVADRAARGDIPPFTLEYDLPTNEHLKQVFDTAARVTAGDANSAPGGRAAEGEADAAEAAFAGSGLFRLYLLALILDPEAEAQGLAEGAVGVLVVYGGQWGEELGRAILTAHTFSRQAKLAAVRALVERGVFRPEEPIPIVVDGRETVVKLKTVTISSAPDAAAQKALDEARRLRGAGENAAALTILEELEAKGSLCAPALMMQANLYRTLERPRAGLRLLDLLEGAFPDEPTVLFNLAGVWLDLGDREKAVSYLVRLEDVLEGQAVAPAFAAKMDQLRKLVATEMLLDTTDGLLSKMYEHWREEVADKPLSPDAGLARVLKNMPAVWLDAVCAALGITPKRLRRQREKQIADHLTDAARLKQVVGGLDAQSLALLRYLLAGGGWRRSNAVTRRFGALEGDEYYWNEKPPASPVGVLWSRALVGVGRATLGGRRCRVVTVPVELRPLLSRVLEL